jgi:hypothetical protein
VLSSHTVPIPGRVSASSRPRCVDGVCGVSVYEKFMKLFRGASDTCDLDSLHAHVFLAFCLVLGGAVGQLIERNLRFGGGKNSL